VNELPICRHFIACERVEQTAERTVTLHTMTVRIVPRSGEAYPLERKDQCFLAVLTSGTGRHQIHLGLRRGVGGFDELVWRSQPGMIGMGNDPMAIRVLPFRFDWVIEKPSQFEFIVYCDGLEIASLYLDAEV
jgi:hypothetical protein